MNIEILDKSYFCEVPVPASSTAQQFFFPTLNNLDGKYTQGISCYPVELMAVAPSKSPVASRLLMQSSFLQLFVGDEIRIYNIPLIDLITVRTSLSTAAFGSNPFAYEFNNLKIIWAKSFVWVADTATIADSAASFVFNIKYTDGVQQKEM